MNRAERHLAIERLLDLAIVLVAPLDGPVEAAEAPPALPPLALPPLALAPLALPPLALPPIALAEALEATRLDQRGTPFDDGPAIGALRLLAEGRQAEALASLSTLLDAPLQASGLETRLEELGARLARAGGDERLALRFLERRAVYRRRHRPGHAVELGTRLLADPAWLEDLEAMLGAGPDEDAADARVDAYVGANGTSGRGADQEAEREAGFSAEWASRPSALAPLAQPSLSQAEGSFVPLAQEPDTPGGGDGRPPGGDSPTWHEDAAGRDGAMAYLVTLHHLEDARTADFSAHRIGWHELESGLAGVSDLVLSFEHGAERLLRQVDPEVLSLRLFFGEGPGYDEFSTAAGSLFDVEVNPAELRIYVKLRRPAAWSATGLPAAELWRQLSSCVLITEPG